MASFSKLTLFLLVVIAIGCKKEDPPPTAEEQVAGTWTIDSSEIGALANLETLKLSNNPLESLPAELANCSKLKTLVLKGTKVSAEDVATLQAKLPNLKIKI